jgi:Ca2+/H+ antiporter
MHERSSSFDGWEVAPLFASVFYIDFMIPDGRLNWHEGAALPDVFMMISVAALKVALDYSCF